MINLKVTARKIGLISITSIFALSFVALSFASASTQQRPEYLISINIACFNPTFCGPFGEHGYTIPPATPGPSWTANIGAALYKDGHQTVVWFGEQWNAKGQVAYTYTTNWVGSWVVGADGNFVLSGLNTTTVVAGNHATTTRSHFTFDTGIPGHALIFNCAEYFEVASCPTGVSAELAVGLV